MRDYVEGKEPLHAGRPAPEAVKTAFNACLNAFRQFRYVAAIHSACCAPCCSSLCASHSVSVSAGRPVRVLIQCRLPPYSVFHSFHRAFHLGVATDYLIKTKKGTGASDFRDMLKECVDDTRMAVCPGLVSATS